MNYLIKLLKSNFLKFAVLYWLDDLNRVASARKAYSTHFLVVVKGVVFDVILTTSKTAGYRKSVNCLTNQGFYTLCTAGNAWRPRQRMRTLRVRCRVGKGCFEITVKKVEKSTSYSF